MINQKLTRTQERGLGFGIISGVITTLGLMTGLFSSTESLLAIIGGILTIAVADASSDALSMHVSEESGTTSKKRIWDITKSTFFTKLLTALSFIIIVIILPLSTSVIVSIIYGLAIITAYSYYISKKKKENPLIPILEHTGIGVLVIIVTYYLGLLVRIFFGA